MKQKVLFLSVVFVLLASLLIAGCAAPAPQQVITLKYADQNPETGWAGKNAAAPWLKQIEEATKGAVKCEGYYAQSLFKGTDAWEGLKGNQADFAWCFHGYWAGLTPLADVFALPFLPITSAEQGSAVWWKIYEKYPAIQKQFEANKVVLCWTASPYFLITKSKPVKTLEDFKGMKIRTSSVPTNEMAKNLGAVPTPMGMPDTYLNLDKGVIDGMLLPWEAIYSFKQYEVAKYYTYAPFNSAYFTQSFSLATWNKLPKNIQDQIMSVGGLKGSMFWGKNMFDTAADVARAAIKEKKAEMIEYTVPAAEIEKWREVAGKPLWESWVKEQEGKGSKDARNILNDVLQMLKDYK
jgi:TRAP-type C4-dicarboxylate transport system substrate-binding protein